MRVQTELVTIVGAAILDDQGRVLGAERAEPPAMAGMWEFPGGKVEPGEAELDALIRECEEELGVGIEILDRLGGDILLPTGTAVLKVWTARLTRGEPTAIEHSGAAVAVGRRTGRRPVAPGRRTARGRAARRPTRLTRRSGRTFRAHSPEKCDRFGRHERRMILLPSHTSGS